ncbi:hypothetical protein [Streptomyces sp. CB03238]|uniref:hypothetical protein n=1 Tax=Streptomyces sp. CB03238 TaxID=1907777 RepID=UPI000A100A4D|nr:hypothetical protein [Streptomyces sp. CB03238]ORT58213.1 hypothetical protein BKD26_20130 [Streptomyces sp. CB03238]
MTDTLTKTDEARNFLGIPITGDIAHGSTRVPQITKEEFAALLKPVLDHPDVHCIGWRQYTPYFNDGDTCEFSAHEVWLVTTHDLEQYEYLVENDPYMVEEDLAVGSERHPTLGGRPHHWDDDNRRMVYEDYQGEHRALYDAANALDAAVQSGKSDHVLIDLFGDHCQVVVYKDKIEVEEYSHD